MQPNAIDILANCPLFSEVDERGFQHLVTIARLVRFSKGQIVFREGEPCPGVYVIGQGMVRVFKTGPGGKEHVLHIAGPGHSFAEVAAMADMANPASAEAVTDVLCVFLPADRFRGLLDSDHPFCRQMLTSMAMWVRRLVRQLEDVVLHDAVGRLARYLLDIQNDGSTAANVSTATGPQEIELPALKRHVAAHLALTSETFSRTIRRLEEMGVIRTCSASRIELLDPARLARIAQGDDP
ncbi:transcriptional regulator Dnr [Thermostilla marina]